MDTRGKGGERERGVGGGGKRRQCKKILLELES